MKALVLGLAAAMLTGCEPSERQVARQAERRIACLDKVCEGDVSPKHDFATETTLKLNGTWFIGPKAYFSAGINGAAFYWPSRTPVTGRPDGRPFPEMRQRFYDVAIEILLRSSVIPPHPRGYRLIALAEQNDWIARRRTLRAGLEQIEMKHVVGPRGYTIDHVTYYVATELKGPDGLPPVAACNHKLADGGGGSGFMWIDGIWAGIRMNQRHCADWPEIYQEATRVLQLLRKA